MWSSQVLANAALARSYVAPLPTVAPVAPVVPAVAPLRRSATLATTGLGWNGLTSGYAGYPYSGYNGVYGGLGYAGYNGLGTSVAVNNALRRSQLLGLGGLGVTKVVV